MDGAFFLLLILLDAKVCGRNCRNAQGINSRPLVSEHTRGRRKHTLSSVKIKFDTSEPTLAERIAVHLIGFPLDEHCAHFQPADQLLKDVLNQLRLIYPGAYNDLTPLASRRKS